MFLHAYNCILTHRHIHTYIAPSGIQETTVVTPPSQGENPPPWPLSKQSNHKPTNTITTLALAVGSLPKLDPCPAPPEAVSSGLEAVSNIFVGQQQQQQQQQ